MVGWNKGSGWKFVEKQVESQVFPFLAVGQPHLDPAPPAHSHVTEDVEKLKESYLELPRPQRNLHQGFPETGVHSNPPTVKLQHGTLC